MMAAADCENYAEPCLLKLSVKKGCLHVAAWNQQARDKEEGGSIDVGVIYRRLCSNYTERLLEEFSEIFDQDELSVFSGYGIDARSVECDLLKGVYNRVAFDYLLAEEVVKQVRSLGLYYRRVSVNELEGVYGLKSSLLLKYLSPGQPGKITDSFSRLARKAGFMATACSALLVAAVVSVYTVILSMYRGEKVDLDDATGQLFLLHSDMGNRVSHLLPELTSKNDCMRAICLLGAGISKPVPVPIDDVNVCVIRPWCRKKILQSVWVVIRAWPLYSRLLQRIAEKFKYQPVFFPLLVHSAMCLVRGQLHKSWVENSLHCTLPRPVVLGWSGWSDVTEFDLALQHRGVETVHFLHGLVGDPIGYWGVSSKCICKTQADVALLLATRTGYYGEIAAAPCKQPAGDLVVAVNSRSDDTVLVITNLIHPANYRYKGIAEGRELNLLEIVASSCAPDCALIWRPHPGERNNVSAFARVAAVAERLGFKQDCESALPEQLQHAGIVVSMFSSVLSDIIMSGKVPYVYAGIPYEETPGWNGINDELKFSSRDELSAMLEAGMYQSLADKYFPGLYDLFCYSNTV